MSEYGSDEWFIETAFPLEDKDGLIRIRAALKFLRTFHGDAFMLRNAGLMSSGSATARKFAIDVFKNETVNDASMAVLRNKGQKPEYSKKVLEQWENSLISEVVEKWAFGSVLDELGIRVRYSQKQDFLENIALIHAYLLDALNGTRPVEAAYWRGVSIYAVSGVSRPESFSKSSRDSFLRCIRWAGGQGDLTTLVDTIKERGTTDLETLRGVIIEKQNLIAPLTNGAL